MPDKSGGSETFTIIKICQNERCGWRIAYKEDQLPERIPPSWKIPEGVATATLYDQCPICMETNQKGSPVAVEEILLTKNKEEVTV